MSSPEASAELERALDELEITGVVRSQMLAEPERALAVIAGARRARGIRNPAAFAIARWRQVGRRPSSRRPAPVDVELAVNPPTLETLEFLWSRPPTIVGGLVLKLIAAALEHHGGYTALRADFERRRSDAA